MTDPLRLMAVLAHPDDESLGCGGTLARAASEGIETYLVTATHGQSGRYRGLPQGDPGHPGPERLAEIREIELRAAARALGIREVTLFGYVDKQLDRADPGEVIGRIAAEIRRVRPQVVITFDPQGGYGHPDHIAISQFAGAGIVAAANPAHAPGGAAPHAVSKLYYFAWTKRLQEVYEAAFRRMVSLVDGVERSSVAWPDWSITTIIDTRAQWETVWKAVACHESQITAYEKLRDISPEHHESMWGWQYFYRVFSTVNGGRARESDLFEGLRAKVGS